MRPCLSCFAVQAEIEARLGREPALRVGPLEDDPEYKLVVSSNALIQVQHLRHAYMFRPSTCV